MPIIEQVILNNNTYEIADNAARTALNNTLSVTPIGIANGITANNNSIASSGVVYNSINVDTANHTLEIF